MAMDNIHICLSENLFLGNCLPGVRDEGESSVSWSLAGLILVFWRVTHSTVSQLLYALGKHQLKFPLKCLEIEMLQEQRLLSESYFSWAFRKWLKKCLSYHFRLLKSVLYPVLVMQSLQAQLVKATLPPTSMSGQYQQDGTQFTNSWIRFVSKK